MEMAREVARTLVAALGSAVLYAGAIPDHAGQIQESLRDFGLVGHWAQDCTSAPSYPAADNRRPLNMQLYIEISPSGSATAETDMGLAAGRITSTVIGARPFDEERLELTTHTDNELFDGTTTTVFVKIGGKLLVWSGRSEGVGKQDAPTDAAGPIARGVPFEFEAVRDGEMLSRGKPVEPAPAYERCENTRSSAG